MKRYILPVCALLFCISYNLFLIEKEAGLFGLDALYMKSWFNAQMLVPSLILFVYGFRGVYKNLDREFYILNASLITFVYLWVVFNNMGMCMFEIRPKIVIFNSFVLLFTGLVLWSAKVQGLFKEKK